MQVRCDYPYAVREIENTWIPLSDGARLAARIWLPTGAELHPVPAILEYLPYRKDDATAGKDAVTHPYFAGHGYASIRVDMRGSGDSDGILLDEYLKQEQDDALEVLAWIAAQPWSTGAVGMIGISWGGFNGLQVAARRPQELKAVISLCSTDDRYLDDCHYMGGCVVGSDMLNWASNMLEHNARPPDPRFVGERWREIWLDRMVNSPPFVEAWLAHQRRDAFWKHGSIIEDYAAVACPVYMVGGWADAYTNSIPRVLAGLPGPRKGLIGPWAHTRPHLGVPGPAIGFLQECLRWWDHWLKGIDTGIMAEPMLRVWMSDATEPRPFQAEWPGHWIAEPVWPPARPAEQIFLLGDGRLNDQPEQTGVSAIRGVQAAGLNSAAWCAYDGPADLPTDQRIDDGLFLTFTSAPVHQPVDILGFPEVTLEVSFDRPQGLIAARLCDVAPGGSSTLVSWGLLNVTHRDSHEDPTPLDPGRKYRVTMRLNAAGYTLAAGHRWRLGLSPTYWPHAWPSPQPVTLSIFTGEASRLVLPLRLPKPEDEMLAPFGPAEGSAPLPVVVLNSPQVGRTIEHDVATGSYRVVVYQDGGRTRQLRDGEEYASTGVTTYTITEGDPLSAQVRCDRTCSIGRGDWRTRVQTVSIMSADAECFRVTNQLEAFEGNARVFTKTWNFAVLRDMV